MIAPVRPDARDLPGTLERARVAVSVAFVVNGLAFASWISRVPAVRDALELTPGRLGLLLLALSVGAVVALPLSGLVLVRLGPARTVLTGAAVLSAGLLVAAAGLAAGSVPVVATGLVLTGYGTGSWDVAMNVEAAAVEHGLGRHVMPRFHAGYSIGTVAGALLGAVCAAAGVPVAAQLAVTGLLVAPALVPAVRAFLPAAAATTGATGATGAAASDGATGAGRTAASDVGRAWREPRTLVIGVMVLAFALVEGIANDWLALALVDGHGTSEALGAAGFGLFVATMTVVRLVGGSLLDRWGRPLVLRTAAALAVVGIVLVVLADALPLVALGTLLWGCGAALGFPVGMSAAADDPERAAVRVSVVSSIAYTAFLTGPPVVGLLAEAFGVLDSLLVVLVALVVGGLTAGATRPTVNHG